MSGVDPCFAPLLGHPRAHIRAPGPDADIVAFREAVDAPLRAMTGERVDDVRDLIAGDGPYEVPVRLYRPSADAALRPLIMFVHGGGFVAGSRDTHDALCHALCLAADADILSVEYRLAPEHPYPAAIEDCRAVLRWIAASGMAHRLNADSFALCGDSAGGYIAMATALATRGDVDTPRIGHIALIYPVVDPACDTRSMAALANGHLLTRGAMEWFWAAFAGRGMSRREDLSLLRQDLSGLPPVSVITAEFDPLCDEGKALHDKLATIGAAATFREYGGMIHGFVSLLPLTPVAGQAIRDVADDILSSLSAAAGLST